METNLAVLIDFENIAAGTEKEGLGRFDVETLMRYIKDKGRILLARSYADWGRFSRFKQSLLAANVTMMELTSHGMQDKNRADIAMVVDALELAFTKEYIDVYVVVSGDSDFTPMVLKMRELNKRVIGIGTRKSTSRLLIQACDEFMYYDSLVQPKQKKRQRTKSPSASKDRKSAAFDLLEEALDGLLRENPEPPLASIVKTAMLRKSPDFAESDLGFSSFARFLEEARDEGIVRISRDRKSGGYRVDSSEGPEHEEEEEEEERPEKSGRDWIDEYMPDEAKPYCDVLDRSNRYPFAFPTRMAVLEALESVVAERRKRRRKTTLKYVVEDVQKKLRRTHPDMPPKLIKGLLEGLLDAGELIHRDGTAIRSSTAPFTLEKDAEGLNASLVRLFLAMLTKAGRDLTNTELLAELLLGDRERTREVEETLAYLAARADEDDDDDDESSDDAPGTDLDDDLDALLVAGDEGIDDLDAALVATEEPAPKKKSSGRGTRSSKEGEEAEPKPAARRASSRRSSQKKTGEDAEEEKAPTKSKSKAAAGATDEVGETSDEATATSDAETRPTDEETKPKRRTRTRRSKKAEDAPTGDAEDAAASESADAEAAPKRPARRRTPKAAESSKESGAPDASSPDTPTEPADA